MKKIIKLSESKLIEIIEKIISEQAQIGLNGFSQFIKTQNKLVIVEFTATWCGPCQEMKKVFDEIMMDSNLKNKFVFGTFDFDQFGENKWNHPIVKKYGIQGIPFVLFFRDGNLVHKFMGKKSKEYIKSKIFEL